MKNEDIKMPDIYIEPDISLWSDLVKRYAADDEDVDQSVAQIIHAVATEGDDALRRLSQKFDGFVPEKFEVTAEAMANAANEVPQKLKEAIDKAIVNISVFHRAQKMSPIEVETTVGVKCCQRAVAINTVGLYIPGGRAPLFSTVLMLAVPAKIAGCKEIVMCTPPNKDGKIAPAILYAANRCGIDKVFAVGGAQAIAAMAYGTATVTRVDKIFGPGNRFVTRAKEMLRRRVAIDMPAGPSEVMVLADDKANAAYVASDLLSQCEHGPDSQSMLVCRSLEFAENVIKELKLQVPLLSRKAIVEQSLRWSRIVVLNDKDEMLQFANLYAPEHLIINMDNPWDIANEITNAGSVFIGAFSPESAGDYASGTNHTLPTCGWANAYSGVNLDSFMKKITYQQLTREGLVQLASVITTMAEAEGLDAHAQAVNLRLEK